MVVVVLVSTTVLVLVPGQVLELVLVLVVAVVGVVDHQYWYGLMTNVGSSGPAIT